MSQARREREAIDAATGDDRPRLFTNAQRRALAALLAIFLACTAVALVRNRAHVPDPMPAVGPRSGELVDRLDPNVADAASLAALPGMGARRAADIVAYRERARAGDPTRVVFEGLDDLMRVRGIGYALSRSAEPYLMFPTMEPAKTEDR